MKKLLIPLLCIAAASGLHAASFPSGYTTTTSVDDSDKVFIDQGGTSKAAPAGQIRTIPMSKITDAGQIGKNILALTTTSGVVYVRINADNSVTLLSASDFKTALSISQSDVSGLVAALAGKEPTITAGTTAQYWRGDKSWQTLDKSAVGLPNVDNTSDANKPVSTAMQTALDGKVPTSRTVTAGTGLSGGGALSGDITISFASDAARVNLTGTTGALDLSGATLTLPTDVTRLGSSISLTTEVSGVLPTANGGAGTAGTDYIAPTGSIASTSGINTPTQTALDGKISIMGSNSMPTLAADAYRANYVMSYFIGSEEKLRVAVSEDGLTFNALKNDSGGYDLYSPPGGDTLRDPSIHKFGDTWYCLYTSNVAGTYAGHRYFGVAKSTDLIHWTWVANPDMWSDDTKSIWAPEWFVDSDGAVYAFFYISGTPYYTRPTSADMSTWATPQVVTGNWSIPILPDMFVARENGRYYALTSNDFLAEASSPIGPWTITKVAGTATSFNTPEGPTLINFGGGRWRLYADEQDYATLGYAGLRYAESFDNMATWTASAPITVNDGVTSEPHKHATVVRVEEPDAAGRIGYGVPSRWSTRDPAVDATATATTYTRITGRTGSSGTGTTWAAGNDWLFPGKYLSSADLAGGIGGYAAHVALFGGFASDYYLATTGDFAVVVTHGTGDAHLKVIGANARAWIQLGGNSPYSIAAAPEVDTAKGTMGVEFGGKAAAGVGSDDGTLYARLWSWNGSGSGGSSTLTYSAWASIDNIAGGQRRAQESTVIRYRKSDRTLRADEIINGKVYPIGTLTLPTYSSSDSVLSMVIIGATATANDGSAACINRESVTSFYYGIPRTILPEF